MSLFKRNPPPEDTTARLERLEIAMRRLEEDWTEVYGKFRTLQMRVAKQVQRAEQAPVTPEGQAGEGESSAPSTLSPRARLIQEQILARRRANGGD